MAVYPVMAVPPSNVGADQETVSDVSPVLTVGLRGGVGTVLGVPDTGDVDGAPVPATLVAVTVME